VDQLTFRAGEVADAYVDAVMGESVARRDQASSSAAAARRRARRCPSGGRRPFGNLCSNAWWPTRSGRPAAR